MVLAEKLLSGEAFLYSGELKKEMPTITNREDWTIACVCSAPLAGVGETLVLGNCDESEAKRFFAVKQQIPARFVKVYKVAPEVLAKFQGKPVPVKAEPAKVEAKTSESPSKR